MANSYQSIYDLSDQVTQFVNKTPDTRRTLKNIAKHLGIQRKHAKAALAFAIQTNAIGVVLRSPLNSRKKRPVYTTPELAKASQNQHQYVPPS